jgi:parvulin-like peptidyl-prolyl isomerase
LPIRRSLVLTLLVVCLAASAAAEVVNRVVLRINGQIATLYDFEQRKADTEREIVSRQEMPLQQRRSLLNNLGERVFRDLFEELLLLSRADQLDIQATDKDVEDAVARMRENFGFSTQEEFDAALASTGMSRAEYYDQIRRNLRMQTLLSREVQSKIEVDEEVLRRYYRDHPEDFTLPEKLRLREVVVLEDGPLPEGERRELARALRAEILGGRPLAQVAEERAARGETSGAIELGWVAPGDLDTDLEQAVWDLEVGQVTEPVEGRGGLHMLEVLERQEAELRPFVEVVEQIRGRERQRRFAEAYREYLETLEKQAFIVADPPPEAANFRRASVTEEPASAMEEAAAEVVAAGAAAEEQKAAEAPQVAGADEPPAEAPPADEGVPPEVAEDAAPQSAATADAPQMELPGVDEITDAPPTTDDEPTLTPSPDSR